MSATAPARALRGAAFLMATSAIGPGFLTQTAVFTDRLGASFGFAILCSVVLDLVAQLVTWRVLVGTGERAPALARAVLPASGTVLAAAVCFGGLAFNVGNVAGCGLGLQAALGLDPRAGALASALLAVALFALPGAGVAMDRLVRGLGLVMLALVLAVVVAARPPLGLALARTVVPATVDPLAIVTIVGGTVGGYITFAGAHRLLDAGVHGPEAVPSALRSAALGIGIASAMRVLLFLAALGVVAGGTALGGENPAAAVFGAAAGPAGRRLFGVVMWAAAITSVVGASYTSVSFLRVVAPAADARPRVTLAIFVAISTAIFLLAGRPVALLVAAGAVNGFILPLGLGLVLLATRRLPAARAVGPPAWLAAAAAVTAALLLAAGAREALRLLQ